jgi:hypothetical protein
LLATIPYKIFIGDWEAYYHTIFNFFLKSIAAEARPEEENKIDKFNVLLKAMIKIYIMELKMGNGDLRYFLKLNYFQNL